MESTTRRVFLSPGSSFLVGSSSGLEHVLIVHQDLIASIQFVAFVARPVFGFEKACVSVLSLFVDRMGDGPFDSGWANFALKHIGPFRVVMNVAWLGSDVVSKREVVDSMAETSASGHQILGPFPLWDARYSGSTKRLIVY